YRIQHAWGLPALALTGLVLALPLAAWAAAPSPNEPAAPTVSTHAARASGSSVLLEGAVDPHTLATTYYFQYGPTTTYGQQTAVGTLAASPTATAPVEVSEPAPGINASYHYRIVGSNSAGPHGV